MFDRFRSFLDSFSSDQNAKGEFTEENPKVAMIALCLQVIDADGLVLDSEKHALKTVIQQQYGLDEAQYSKLLSAGENAERASVDYYKFTSVLKKVLNEEQQAELIGILWEIVYADGERSELEDNIVWRVAELLGVPSRVRIMKRQEVVARLSDKINIEKIAGDWSDEN
jgi:uncharacterized tellurite resistance protein B-like protein